MPTPGREWQQPSCQTRAVKHALSEHEPGARHEPTLDEQRRVTDVWAEIRQTLANHRHRSHL